MTSALEVLVDGRGPRVVLVHGSIAGADTLWAPQLPLAERWTLVRPNRRGFGASPPVEGEDFEVDAEDIATLIEPGDHLVGHSYGGVVSLLAAARRPDLASLTVLEPPAHDIARGDPVVESSLRELAEIRKRVGQDIDAFIRAFAAYVGSTRPLPRPLTDWLERGARLAFHQRPPVEARIPLDTLRAAPFPKLVVSGDGHPSLGKVCDVLEKELDAQRAYVGGVGHTIPAAGDVLNDILERFWESTA